jgi:deoxyribodipyrimidine photo-lyase
MTLMKLRIRDGRLDNPRYDSLEGCYDWAKETLRTHTSDKRDVIYSRDEFEQALTHDDLWNAAQIQMTRDGKMHVSILPNDFND